MGMASLKDDALLCHLLSNKDDLGMELTLESALLMVLAGYPLSLNLDTISEDSRVKSSVFL